MSANPLPKRLLSLVLTLCMVISLVPMSALAEGDPSSDPNRVDNAIVNGSFEKPGQTKMLAPQLEAQTVPGWSTTATGHLIEFGVNIGRSYAPQLWGSDKSIPNGNQFAELNADEVSTLYQNVSTVGGHIYEWGLSHRGREGTDTMALIIGPHQDNAPAKPDKTGQDQFMRLTDWVKRNAKTLGVTVPTDGCSQRITVYSKKFDENGGFLNNTGSESPFSTAPSNLYTETWSVWIIATGNQSWGSYGTHNRNYNPLKGIGGGIGCSYTVPARQTETTFAFCSYSSSGSGGLTVGNLLDNITFSLYHNVTFTTTAGGEGTVSAEIPGRDPNRGLLRQKRHRRPRPQQPADDPHRPGHGGFRSDDLRGGLHHPAQHGWFLHKVCGQKPVAADAEWNQLHLHRQSHRPDGRGPRFRPVPGRDV